MQQRLRALFSSRLEHVAISLKTHVKKENGMPLRTSPGCSSHRLHIVPILRAPAYGSGNTSPPGCVTAQRFAWQASSEWFSPFLLESTSDGKGCLMANNICKGQKRDQTLARSITHLSLDFVSGKPLGKKSRSPAC